jgi:hypothetical protein
MLPIEYGAVVMARDGHEGHVDLEEDGWLDRADVRDCLVFSLRPKPGVRLPVVSVEVGPGKELVYFSRVFGTVGFGAPGEETDGTDLFRLYCIGWRMHFPNAAPTQPPVQALLWVYPSGSVVSANEPPYVDELMRHYIALRSAAAALKDAGASQVAG